MTVPLHSVHPDSGGGEYRDPSMSGFSQLTALVTENRGAPWGAPIQRGRKKPIMRDDAAGADVHYLETDLAVWEVDFA